MRRENGHLTHVEFSRVLPYYGASLPRDAERLTEHYFWQVAYERTKSYRNVFEHDLGLGRGNHSQWKKVNIY